MALPTQVVELEKHVDTTQRTLVWLAAVNRCAKGSSAKRIDELTANFSMTSWRAMSPATLCPLLLNFCESYNTYSYDVSETRTYPSAADGLGENFDQWMAQRTPVHHVTNVRQPRRALRGALMFHRAIHPALTPDHQERHIKGYLH